MDNILSGNLKIKFLLRRLARLCEDNIKVSVRA